MNFELQEHKSVGPITFGMQCNNVRQALNSDFTSSPRRHFVEVMGNIFQTSNLDYPIVDMFRSLKIVAHYDMYSGKCDSVKFYGKIIPTFQGVKLLGDLSIDSLKEWLDSIGGECKIEDDFVVSHVFGIILSFAVEMPAQGYDQIKILPPKEVNAFTHGYLQ